MPGQSRRTRRGTAPARRKVKPKRQKTKPKQPKTVEVKIQSGLLNELVRVTPQGLHTITTMWMLNKEDIIIRIPKQTQETDIVLRGHSDAIIRIRQSNMDAMLPVADVVLRRDMIDQILRDQEEA